MKVVFLLFASFAQAPEAQIERSFHAGQRDMQEGNFAHAAEEFKEALTLDPTLIEAEVNLGLAYQSLFEYDLAVHYLSKALHERPNLLAPNVIAGMDYLKLGSPEKAIPFLQQALKLDPVNRDAREASRVGLSQPRKLPLRSRAIPQIGLPECRSSRSLFNLGHQYLDLAARFAYRGAHLYHDSAWGHRFLGDLFLQRGRWDDALKEYRKGHIRRSETTWPAYLARPLIYMPRIAGSRKRISHRTTTRSRVNWHGWASRIPNSPQTKPPPLSSRCKKCGPSLQNSWPSSVNSLQPISLQSP